MSSWPVIYYILSPYNLLSISQYYLYHPWVIDLLIMWSTDISWLIRAYVKFYFTNYCNYIYHDHTFLGSPKRTHCLIVYEISWCLYWEYLVVLTSINSDPIHRKYMCWYRALKSKTWCNKVRLELPLIYQLYALILI